jgi:hypothetical protein
MKAEIDLEPSRRAASIDVEQERSPRYTAAGFTMAE